MNVCLLNDSFPPVIDGVANVVMNYADHLTRDHDARVTVATPYYPQADDSALSYPVVRFRSLGTEAVASGYRAGDPFETRAVVKLADFAPDILHVHCPAATNLLARLVREQTGAPLVYTYHTKYNIDIERVIRIKPLAREVISAMVDNIQACDEVWVVSRGAGENLRELGYRGDYRVMPNGVDFERGRADQEAVARATAAYDLPEHVPVYLFVGRIITYKGLPLILDALSHLAAAGKDFRMVFVGKGPDRELLESRAADLGIGEKCIFTGPIYDRETLRAWNTRADLFLFPSTFDTNGLVVREAAACGLASVLVRGSCAAEDITDGQTGFLIDETAESLFQCLLELSDLRELTRRVGQRAMDEIYLSWGDCVTRAYHRYEAILQAKAAGDWKPAPRQPGDLLLSLTARRMEEQEKLRRLAQSRLDPIRQAAAGMMENIQDREERLVELRRELETTLLHKEPTERK